MERCVSCGVLSFVGDDGICAVCRDPRWRAFLATRVARRRPPPARLPM